MQDTFARAHTRPKGGRPSARATIGYLVYKRTLGLAAVQPLGRVRARANVSCIQRLLQVSDSAIHDYGLHVT